MIYLRYIHNIILLFFFLFISTTYAQTKEEFILSIKDVVKIDQLESIYYFEVKNPSTTDTLYFEVYQIDSTGTLYNQVILKKKKNTFVYAKEFIFYIENSFPAQDSAFFFANKAFIPILPESSFMFSLNIIKIRTKKGIILFKYSLNNSAFHSIEAYNLNIRKYKVAVK